MSFRLNGSKSTFCLMLILVLFPLLFVGCKPQTPTESAAPISVSDSQTPIQKTSDSFLTAVSRKQFADALKFASPAYSQSTAAKLSDALNGSLKPLDGATNFSYEPVEMLAHGNRAVERLTFTAQDKRMYRTNVVLTKSKDQWQVVELLDPKPHTNANMILNKGVAKTAG